MPKKLKPHKLTPLGEKLFRQALKQIRKYPLTVDMSDWVAEGHSRFHRTGPKAFSCGTTACMAGHIYIAAGGSPHIGKFTNVLHNKFIKNVFSNHHSVSDTVEDLLFANTEEDIYSAYDSDGSHLFYTGNWPLQFRETYIEFVDKMRQYRNSRGLEDNYFDLYLKRLQKQAVNVLLARMNHYLETGE